jgi:hypothetical protein
MSGWQAPADLAAAARRWGSFPASVVPRPYVVLQPAVVEAGYRTGAAKAAFLQGRLRFAAAVPQAAVEALVAAGVQLSDEEPALLVRAADRVRHGFRTDRGARTLPAWSLQVEDSVGPVIVLDDELGRSWRPASSDHGGQWYSGDTAAVAQDGITVRFSFVGSPRIYTDYPTAEVYETATVVVIAPEAVDRPGSEVRLLYAETRVVTVQLHSPLGQRVLVNAAGLAVAVSADAQDG